MAERWMEGPIRREQLGVVPDRRRAARHALHGRSADRPRTTGAAIAPAPTCSPIRSSPSTSRPASTSGISKPCITTCGTPTCRRRRRSWTSMQNGRTVPALASVGKTGWMFILDRTNGKPIFGVEERPVPKGDVPGEWYSPTQPFPAEAAGAWRASISRRSATWSGPKTRRPHTCGVPGAVGQERRVLQRGTVHAVHVPRRRRAAEEHDSVSRRHRRRQLGRRGRGSAERATSSSTRTTRRWSDGSRRRSRARTTAAARKGRRSLTIAAA